MIGVKVVPTSRGWWGDGGRDLLLGKSGSCLLPCTIQKQHKVVTELKGLPHSAAPFSARPEGSRSPRPRRGRGFRAHGWRRHLHRACQDAHPSGPCGACCLRCSAGRSRASHVIEEPGAGQEFALLASGVEASRYELIPMAIIRLCPRQHRALRSCPLRLDRVTFRHEAIRGGDFGPRVTPSEAAHKRKRRLPLRCERVERAPGTPRTRTRRRPWLVPGHR
jgi:hypothetical protein